MPYLDDPLTMLNSALPGAQVRSATRTYKGNQAVGGVTDSAHLKGEGLDITPGDGRYTRSQIVAAVKAAGGVPFIESDHVHSKFPGSKFPLVGKQGTEGQGPDFLVLGGRYLDDPVDTNQGGQLVEGDKPITMEAANKLPKQVEPTTVDTGGLAAKAWTETVGKRLGIDEDNPDYETIKKYSGFLWPLVDAGTATLEGIQGAISSLIAHDVGALGNIVGADPDSSENAARSSVDLANSPAMLLLGAPGTARPRIPPAPPELIANLQKMREAGATDAELKVAAGPYQLKGLEEAQLGSKFEAVAINDNPSVASTSQKFRDAEALYLRAEKSKAHPKLLEKLGDRLTNALVERQRTLAAYARKKGNEQQALVFEKDIPPEHMTPDELMRQHGDLPEEFTGYEPDPTNPYDRAVVEEQQQGEAVPPSVIPYTPNTNNLIESTIAGAEDWKVQYNLLKKELDDAATAARRANRKNKKAAEDRWYEADKNYNEFIINTDPLKSKTPKAANDIRNYDDLALSEEATKIWHDTRNTYNREHGIDENAPIDLNGPDIKVADQAVRDFWAQNDRRDTPREQAMSQDIDEPSVEAPVDGDGTPPGEPPAGGGLPPEGPDPVGVLREALAKAGPGRKAEDLLTKEGRKKQIAKMLEARKSGAGRARLSSELSAMKGRFEKTDFEPIADKISEADKEALFDIAADFKYEGAHGETFSPVTARLAIQKLFDGEVPTNKELDLLRQVFSDDLIDAIPLDDVTKKSLAEHTSDILNIPRTLKSSMDLSAPLRQGVTRVHTKEFWQAGARMFKYLWDEKNYEALKKDIWSRPNADLYEEYDLAVGDRPTPGRGHNMGPGGPLPGEEISTREEAFLSPLAEHLPEVGGPILSAPAKVYNKTYGRWVRATDRAYSGFLHDLRANTFDNLLTMAEKAGADIDSPKFGKQLARFVNNSTGRGDFRGGKPGSIRHRVGEMLNDATPIMNALFFSPKFQASRVALLNPMNYLKTDPFVRMQYIKQAIAFGGIVATILTLFKLNGADVETDLRSSNALKIVIPSKGGLAGVAQASPGVFGVGASTYGGKIHYDIMGGVQQYAVLAERIRTSQKKDSKENIKDLKSAWNKNAKGYKPEKLSDTVGSFARGKEAPLPSVSHNALAGENVVGEKFSTGQAVEDLVAPMFWSDVAAAYNNDTRSIKEKNDETPKGTVKGKYLD